MNRYLIVALFVLGSVGVRLHSQMPTQDPALLLQQIKASNADTITKQTATLQALDNLAKDADQVKIFSKRG
ncbi:MAG: hypothetical protein QM796_00915 [Chthoniobacteraceae bacterium]